jgi:hypothetical protein
MVLDYRKLKLEFEQIKKREQKSKKLKKGINTESSEEVERTLKEEIADAKQQEYWEYLNKELA